MRYTLYADDVAFGWSTFASSISRRRNLSSTKCRTIHLRSSEHSSVFRTSSLHFSIALLRSWMVASWSRTNCHCSLIKLLGMACDLSDPSSPDTTDASCSVDGLVGNDGILVDVPSTGDVAIFVLVIRLVNVFGRLAILPRSDCISSNWLFQRGWWRRLIHKCSWCPIWWVVHASADETQNENQTQFDKILIRLNIVSLCSLILGSFPNKFQLIFEILQ